MRGRKGRMPKGKNHSSKRTSLHQKYKIQKKVAEHRRKIKKDEKAKARKGVKLSTRIKKDPGIPNLWPFKEQLLREVEEHKEQVQKDKIQMKLDAKKERERLKKGMLSPQQQMANLKNSVLSRTANFEIQQVRRGITVQKCPGPALSILSCTRNIPGPATMARIRSSRCALALDSPPSLPVRPLRPCTASARLQPGGWPHFRRKRESHAV